MEAPAGLGGRRSVVVLGAGIAGSATALAFADAGWDVALVEQDRSPVPSTAAAAFAGWERPTVPQFRQSHAFLPRLRLLLAERAPDVLYALHDAGAVDITAAEHRPDTLEDYVEEPGDAELTALGCRRATLEWVLRAAVGRRAAISIVLERARGVVLDQRTARVRGVVLEDGSELLGDLVVDAGGARSAVPRWLRDAGGGEVDEQERRAGIVYATRFYERRTNGPAPSGPLRQEIGPVLCAVFPADAGAFSVTVVVPGDDAGLRGITRNAAFDAVVARSPVAAPWVDGDHATPVTDVHAMGALTNRVRRIVRDGRVTVGGLALVGDAAVRSNPVHGAGCTAAFVEAFGLADACTGASSLDEAVVAFDALVDRQVLPWHDAAVAADDLRARDDHAARTTRLLQRALRRAIEVDAGVWRRAARVANLLDPPESLHDPHVLRRVMELAPTAPPVGEDRGLDELRRLVARSA